MQSAECFLDRRQELGKQVTSFMKGKNRSITQVRRDAGVSYSTVRIIIDPNYKPTTRVSKKIYVKVVDAITPDNEERSYLRQLGGVTVINQKGSGMLPGGETIQVL